MKALPVLKLSKATDAEINAAVAEYVMGRTIRSGPTWPRFAFMSRDDGLSEAIPRYLDDAHAVMALLDTISSNVWGVTRVGEMFWCWTVPIKGTEKGHGHSIYGRELSFCRAACVALLRASGKVRVET